MIIIYGKASCKSCDEAKQLCTNNSVEYEYKQMGKDYDLSEFYSIAPRSVKSFPMVAIVERYDGVDMHEQYIGGLVELKEILATKYSK